MKEDINIEELFKQKFENFEGNVDPSVWANVSQSIGAGASGGAAGGAGLSGLAKVAIITGAVAVTSVTAWYFTQNNDPSKSQEQVLVDNTTDELADETTISVENLVAEDTNDPIIKEQEDQIHEEMGNIVISDEHFDQETIEMVLMNENTEISIDHQPTQGNDQNNNVDETSNNDVVVNDQKDDQDKPDVDPIPSVELKSNLVYELDGNTFIYDSQAENHDNVQWHFGDGNEALGDAGEHDFERPGTYQVTMTVVGENGVDIKEVEVVVSGTSSLGEPYNIITPNGDNSNDYLTIESEDLAAFNITIYDMSGREVYSSDDPDFQWNGEKYDGTKEKGNYIYKIVAEGNDGAIFKKAGTLHVVF